MSDSPSSKQALEDLLSEYYGAAIAVDKFCSLENMSRADHARAAIVRAFRNAEFSPKGDNHHNAKACPYCSPDETPASTRVCGCPPGRTCKLCY